MEAVLKVKEAPASERELFAACAAARVSDQASEAQEKPSSITNPNHVKPKKLQIDAAR